MKTNLVSTFNDFEGLSIDLQLVGANWKYSFRCEGKLANSE